MHTFEVLLYSNYKILKLYNLFDYNQNYNLKSECLSQKFYNLHYDFAIKIAMETCLKKENAEIKRYF